MTDEIRSTIREQLEQGASLEQVDTELIDRLPELDDEARSSLWLYAWHLVETNAGAAAPVPDHEIVAAG